MILHQMSENSSYHVGPAVVGSFSSLLVGGVHYVQSIFANPTLAQITPTADNWQSFAAVVVGVMGVAWSVFNAGPDQAKKILTKAIEALQKQLDDKADEIKEQDGVIKALRMERADLMADVGRLKGLLANAEARLVGMNPAPPASQSGAA
jgi:hypothetical protein